MKLNIISLQSTLEKKLNIEEYIHVLYVKNILIDKLHILFMLESVNGLLLYET